MDFQPVAAGLRNWQTVVLLPLFLLNSVALAIVFLLFVGCLWLVPAGQLSAFYRFVVGVFFFGFLLNTCYELMHSIFYTHFTEPDYTYGELVVMLFGAPLRMASSH